MKETMNRPNFVRKPPGKHPLEIPRRIWDNNIKMNLEKVVKIGDRWKCLIILFSGVNYIQKSYKILGFFFI